MIRRADKPASGKPLKIVLLSGGTGRTAERVVGAALAQFDHQDVCIKHRVGVHKIREAVNVVKEAAKQDAILCHTLVDPKMRAAVVREIERQVVPAVDVLGPALAILEDRLELPPKGRAGLYYELNKEQFDRMDAVDFTLAHDDGAGLYDIERADVVLVGVSRVAKSVTCFYLAYRGIRAANTPIIAGLPLPTELKRVDARKVIGLTMNAQRLQAVRSARFPPTSGGELESYLDMRSVAQELQHARQLMSEHDWHCIDVSYLAVEEIAAEVMRQMGL